MCTHDKKEKLSAIYDTAYVICYIMGLISLFAKFFLVVLVSPKKDLTAENVIVKPFFSVSMWAALVDNYRPEK